MKYVLPFGYVLKNGNVEINEDEAVKLRALFCCYLDGNSMSASGKLAELNNTHSQIKRFLSNDAYIGKNNYPAIIDEETFIKANELRLERAKKMGRMRERAVAEPKAVPTRFKLTKITKNYKEPFAQAAYVYSKIKEVK